jgi:hypothetical protein
VPQLCVPGVEQVPAPEQNAARVSVLPVQEGLAHWTEVDACWQAPPLHRPVLPQVAPVGQRPFGSVLPFVTVPQVPLAVRLQALQVPQAETVQQTPSVQFPLPHSWSAAQIAARAFLETQLPFGPVQ